MPEPHCLAPCPDDQPPIVRTCRRNPDHAPPHRDAPDGVGSKHWTVEWGDE